MTRTSDETTSERAERLLADHTRIQLPPDAWDELVAIMDRRRGQTEACEASCAELY
jgi:uncharacterized protein (DUF1778 family)